MRRIFVMACSIIATAASVVHADPYVLGGMAFADTWSWTGPGLSPFRAAVQNPANFGPGGIVGTSVSTLSIPVGGLTPAALAGIDCFVSPADRDTNYSAADIALLTNWFLAGGDLYLFDDGADFDPIGQALGVPTTMQGGATTLGVGALGFSGPFGSTSTINHAGLIGLLDPAVVAGTGGVVVGTNNGGWPSVAFWDRGVFGPTSGRMIIVTDVDTATSHDFGGYVSGQANFVAMNGNAIFALNTVAFLVPTPSSGAIIGLLGLAAARRRR